MKIPVNVGRRFQRLELRKQREYEVMFRILDSSATGRVTVKCTGDDTPREVFERECRYFGHTNWRYLNAEAL